MGDIDADDLPFLAEYAKSGRASCKGCKKPIDKDSLRLAAMVRSPHFDGKMPLWFHFECFFGKNRVKSISDIKQFGQLRWEDQQKIKEKLVPHGAGGVQANVASSSDLLKDFQIDRAKSSRSLCRGCEQKIQKDFLRVSKKDHESDNAKRYGAMDRWYHLVCFAKQRDDLEFYSSGSVIPGFDALGDDDKELVKLELPEMKSACSSKRPHAEDSATPAKKLKEDKNNNKEEEILKKQNKLIYEFRDKLQKELNKNQWQELLEHNNQAVPSGESRILDRLADCMSFGALLPCPECKGQLVLGTGEYCCHGNITEWTKCTFTTKKPKRTSFDVPEDLKDDHLFLKKYKYVARDREFSAAEMAPSTSKLPLSNLKIAIVGKTKMSKTRLTESISALGGKVVSTISAETAVVISSKDEVDKESKKIEEAKKFNVPVVSEDFITDLKEGNISELLKQKNIGGWGEGNLEKLKSGKAASSSPVIKKITVKGVDPDSGLESKAHVYEEKSGSYIAVLNLVDVVRGTNSYYKLQLLESNDKKKYWVFRAWGRIGTGVGGTKTEKAGDKQEAKDLFKRLYEEKTGNPWGHGDKFVKYPNRFYPMELDDGEKVMSLKDMKSSVQSKLAQEVQNLISAIFDIEIMKKTMIEFEIDMNKMPLGKLSRRQIETAYKILTELQQIIDGSQSENKALDASNRFYTLIPHDFGMRKPPILNNSDIIKTKIEMLDNLLEIEVAYSILKEVDSSSTLNPIDSHYITLKTDIEVLDKNSEEFGILKQYMKNTHAATHNQYSLAIEDVFKIARNGEDKRFKPFKKLHNRMLLWHGSRISNFVGILSRGLQIAPPEAPVTGYMFGKGIYFADMVSKSANYCFATRENPMGLLLLCEVALGDMYELVNANFVTKLPAGKHSTKGVGTTCPNPKLVHTTSEGVIVPFGKPSTSTVAKSSLLYNEYIVYDIAQVNVKYLMKVKFNWKF